MDTIDYLGKNTYSLTEMAWITRLSSKGKIDRAGEALISLPFDDPTRDSVLGVINNWRSCHAYPLQVIKMNLLERAKRIDNSALVSQRIKRLPSIALKLKQNPDMKLSQMQDIGGCRAVLRDIHSALRLAKDFETTKSKNPHSRSIIIEKYDYINEPKEDGYRGKHLIYKYQSDSNSKAAFVGQRIEIQIRSKLQHTWATAVETAQIFTGQALKSRIKSANRSWLRFFALMGSAIASWEKQPNVPNTPDNDKERIQELRILINQEKILECLGGWNATIHRAEDVPILQNAHAFLLILDPTKRSLQIIPFNKEQMNLAQEKYLKAEKANENDPQIQVVLVLVDSIGALRKAYPNYYADTSEFIKAVRKDIA